MKKKYIILLAILAIIIVAILVGSLIITGMERKLERLTDVAISDVDLSLIEDGVFKGSYKAFLVEAEVRVTVVNHIITVIDLIKHNNGQGAPAEVIPDRVVEAQSLEVDVVSGATYSSKVILKAIENALNSAKK